MSLHKLTAGDGYTYLTKQVAAMDATDKGRVSLADYYSAKGESPGVWMGSGLSGLAEPVLSPVPSRPGYTRPDAEVRVVEWGSQVTEAQMKALFGEGRHPNADAIEQAFVRASGSAAAALTASKLGREFAIGDTEAPQFVQRLAERFRDHNIAQGVHWKTAISAEDRARIRSELATEMFTARYGRPPADAREATSFITTETRRAPSSVAGYDLTFSPVKSVSAVWAIAPREMAHAIEAAHAAAVADALAFIEKEAAFSRLGTGGVAQVDCDGLIAAAFTHRDSRAGDPDLHTHVTVSNKVRVTDAAGIKRWMALDGRPLHKAAVSASEVYNSRLEAHCRERLGFAFDDVAGADPTKRAVREVVGVPASLIDAWSSRRAAITVRTDELSKQFQAEHGREPTTTEALDLAQRATLETRAAKHEPRSLAEQRAQWRAQAERVLGGSAGVSQMLAAATAVTAGTQRAAAESLDAHAIDRYAAQVTATVSATRARWSRPHLRAEAERVLRSNETLAAAAITPMVEAIVDAATGPATAIAVTSSRLDGDLNEPTVLRRADGASVYTTHDTDLFTTEAIVSAERRIVAAARRTDGRTIDSHTVEIALLEQAANDRELNAGQAALVRELATSGRRVQVALAPAGTGKTTAMRTLASAWTDSGGTVIGLAPTAAAAAVLRDELGTDTDTVAKLVTTITAHRDHHAAITSSNGHAAAAPATPDWFDRIDASTLLVIDEAGMSGTADLDTVIGHVLAAGGSVRLVGDDQQLASISAGGVLRDVAHETGALTLSEVVRFRDPAEGAASLALRNGDPAALGFYADAHRIHVGADAVAADQAYTAWAADRADGRDAVMLAPTRETVNALNERARADRLAAAGDGGRSRSVRLADGLDASVGDIIATRRNRRDLRVSATDWVRNGDRWQVTDISADGAISARHLDLGRTIVLPRDYVTDNVTLGYASTIHAAQGLTADTCHVIGADTLSKQLLYVAMTRGRAGNHIYLSTAETDPHKVTTPKARTPNTGLEILTAILRRDESHASATTTARDALNPLARMASAAAAYDDAIGSACEDTLGADTLSSLDAAADAVHPHLTDDPAWPVLRKHLATRAVAGDDPIAALTQAYNSREVTTAANVAAVLDWRLDDPRSHTTRAAARPLPWLPAIPTALAVDPTWGRYLTARAARVADLATAIADTAAEWTVGDAPRWARPLIAADIDTALLTEIAVFRAAHGVEDTDRRPTGPEQYAAAPRRTQRRLDEAAAAVVDTRTDLARWAGLADQIDPHLRRDPFWPDLAEHLDQAARAGIDATALVRDAAAAGPLPTEMPAAALWWRLSAELAPATVDTTDSAVRPDWIADLTVIVGDRITDIITHDPAWPGLVAAVTTATATHAWTPREVLATADELLHDSGSSEPTHTVRADEYARALTWRIDLLASTQDSAPVPIPDVAPLSIEDEERALAEIPDDNQHTVHLDDVAAADDDYLAALLADGPPLDDIAADYDDAVGDRYDGLEFTDLTDAVPLPRPQVSTDVAVLIADRYEIAAQHADAVAAAAAAWAEQSDMAAVGGRHEQATIPTVLAMRERQTAQRDTLVAVEVAHAEWVEADHALEHLTDTITSAVDVTDADDVDQLVELRRAAAEDLHAMQVDAATTWVEQCRDRLAAAVAAHTQVCAETGGAVTDADIDLIVHTARSLDVAELNDLRDRRDTLANQLWRIDNALAQRHATTRQHHTDTPPTPVDPVAPAAADLLQAAAPAPTPEPVDPIRLLSDTDLVGEITRARTRLTRIESDMAMHRRRGPARAAEQVRADHTALHAAAAAITRALAADTNYQAAVAEDDTTRADLLAAHRALDTARRRDRPAAHARVADLTRQQRSTSQRVETARAAADVAATATGLHRHQWEQTLTRAADTTALDNELAAAIHSDTTADSRDERLRAERAALTAQLERATVEQQRRAADPEHRPGVAGAAAGTTRAVTPATLSPSAIEVDQGVESGPDL